MANSQFAMAVHVLALLANNCDERVKSGLLAESVNTNPVVIRRLLADLHEAGLVVSQTGYCGGTCLTKHPSEITLREIFLAVSECEVFSLHPNTPNQECDVGLGIVPVLDELGKEINGTVLDKLEDHSLQEIIERVIQIK
ncbi:MAG: Rrf2 family transcriptional regulator [Pyrinomonadaceae bacterium]